MCNPVCEADFIHSLHCTLTLEGVRGGKQHPRNPWTGSVNLGSAHAGSMSEPRPHHTRPPASTQLSTSAYLVADRLQHRLGGVERQRS